MSTTDETKLRFAEALRQIMLEKPFSKISVRDIADAAGISRKSFYNHFQDKYDLINWICYSQFVQISEDVLAGGGWGAFRAFLDFFATDRAFFINALQDMGQNSFGQYFSDLLFEVVYETTHAGFVRQDIDEHWIRLSIAALVEDARLAIIIWLSESEEPDSGELIDFLLKASDGFASMICFERVMRTDGKLCDFAIDTLTEGWSSEPNRETFKLPKPDDPACRRREPESLFSKYRSLSAYAF